MFINVPRFKFKRDVGLFSLCFIGISSTIGGGIFVLLSFGVAAAGEYLPISFLVGGAIALLGAFMYAEIGTTIPRSGSDLTLVFNTASHKYWPFTYAWLVLLGNIAYIVINALGFAFYINFLININPLLIALGALFVAASINIYGMKTTARMEVATGLALGALLTIYIVMALTSASFDFNLKGYLGGASSMWPSIMAGTAVIFAAFAGYEYIAAIAGEAKNPERNIPRGLIVTVLAATLVYSLIAFAAVHTTSIGALSSSDAPLVLAARSAGGFGLYAVIPAAILATGGSLLASVLVASRRLYSIAEEGYFGSVLTKLSKESVPQNSVLVISVLAAGMLIIVPLVFVAYIANVVYLLSLVVVAWALLLLRQKRPFLSRPFRVPYSQVLLVIVVLSAIAILMFAGILALVFTLLWGLLGFLIYRLARLSKERLQLALLGVTCLLVAMYALIVIILLRG